MSPKKLCSEATLFGAGISLIAVDLSGSGFLPFSSIICPRYLILKKKKFVLLFLDLETIILYALKDLVYMHFMFVFILTLD